MVNSGVVATLHVAGVRCDPCGEMRVLNFKKVLKFLNNPVTLARYKQTP